MVDKDQTTVLPLYHTAPIPSTPTVIPSTPIIPETPASPPPYAPPAHVNPNSHEYSQVSADGYIKPTAVVITRSKRNNQYKACICIAFAMVILVILPATIFAVVFKKNNDAFEKESQRMRHGAY
ncbi:hypothetical protein B0J14DRAFT_655103 [Halenospora varia]|nr:hypothetical protein B0J14DRAFT_655103 [Halenospora varia]